VEEPDSDENFNLQRYEINYGRKKFYGIGPRFLQIQVDDGGMILMRLWENVC
jgi:hypothetical protein